jgi:hypothetical protein
MKGEMKNGDYVLTFSKKDFKGKDISRLIEIANSGKKHSPEEVIEVMDSINEQLVLGDKSPDMLMYLVQKGDITMLDMINEIRKR